MTAWPVTEWTLDQLADRVGAALSVDYDGQASGRVREVPDQRAIRYYTTIGLVDRPAAMRGRTALYVRRHLLQLVAIKRLQAGGLTLARIQRELAGATDAQLERVARVPPLEEPTGTAPEAALTPAAAPAAAALPTPRPAFWKHAPQGGAGSPPGFKAATAGAEPPATRAAAAHDAGAPAPAPGVHTATPMAVADEAGGREAPAATATAPEVPPAPTPAGPSPAVAAVVMQGVRLGDGVTLLVEGERALGADEVAAIRAAAGPLLDLVRRGRERS
jgi:DNA-binding transcriptional MerR regulator